MVLCGGVAAEYYLHVEGYESRKRVAD